MGGKVLEATAKSRRTLLTGRILREVEAARSLSHEGLRRLPGVPRLD